MMKVIPEVRHLHSIWHQRFCFYHN